MLLGHLWPQKNCVGVVGYSKTLSSMSVGDEIRKGKWKVGGKGDGTRNVGESVRRKKMKE